MLEFLRLRASERPLRLSVPKSINVIRDRRADDGTRREIDREKGPVLELGP